MASFRSGIKIISDVTKRQGKALLQRSISAENLLAFRGKRSEALSRSVSPTFRRKTEEPQPTDVTTTDRSWFSRFNDRQVRMSTVEHKPRLLTPVKGPQQPNRYFSDFCPKMPKPSDKETNEKQEESGVSCGQKSAKLGTFCENRPVIPTFSVCPKPINKEAAFRCPGPPVPKSKPLKKKVYKCLEKQTSTFKICPKPPPTKFSNMCVAKKPKEAEKKTKRKKPVVISTPRRCLCEDDPVFMESEVKKTPPLYKMNPDVPFRVCPKNNTGLRQETFKWSSSNKICAGESRGLCASKEGQASKKETKVSGSCMALKGNICDTDLPCPFKQPKPSGSAPGSGSSTAKHKPSKSQKYREPDKSDISSKTSTARKVSSKKKSPTKTTTGSSSKQPSKVCGKKSSHRANVRASGSKCRNIRFPGCRVPKSTICVKKPGKHRKCKKVPVPTRCFSECYKGPCPPKECSPCPCVRMLTSTECDVKDKILHLQPKEPIFKIKPPFVIPPPQVELFIDPSIGACCETMKVPPPKPVAPPPCGPSQPSQQKPQKPQKSPSPKPEPEPETPRKGCDCKMFNFVRSLMSYLKGEEQKCPEPTDDIRNVVKQFEDSPLKDTPKKSAKLIACEMDPDVTARKPKKLTKSSEKEKEEKKEKKGKKKKKETKGTKDKKEAENKLCPKFRLPGCREPYRDTCLVVKTHNECKRRPPPLPSFSECLKQPFPKLKCTECRIAMKRAKSLSELKVKGLRVTPENLRVHYSMCLKPQTKGCELMSKPLEFLKTSHSCLMMPCPGGQEAEHAETSGSANP